MAGRLNLGSGVPDSSGHHRQQQQGERRCLSCSRPFASTGPGNRVCRKCKHQDAWKSGVVDFAVHAAF